VKSANSLPDLHRQPFFPDYSLHNAPTNIGGRICYFMDKRLCKQKLKYWLINELICSTSIGRIAAGRDTAM